MNTEAVEVEAVVAHLANFGLITKAPEKIDDAKVLGLKVFRYKNGRLVWQRSNTVEKPTRRELFSITGKPVGHYPSTS